MWAADNISTIYILLYLLQCVFINLTDLEVLYSLLLYKGIYFVSIAISCAWAADNLASLDIPFISVVE